MDQSIRITCQPIATVHNTRSGLLRGAKTNLITYTHAFQVKNTRADEVHIKVLEQLPLSTDERIKVNLSLSLSFLFFTLNLAIDQQCYRILHSSLLMLHVQVTIQEPELKKANSECPLPCGHALLNDSNNVEWHVKAESGVELQLKLIYTVEHPAQDAVEGLPK